MDDGATLLVTCFAAFAGMAFGAALMYLVIIPLLDKWCP